MSKANRLMTKAIEKKMVANHIKSLETGGSLDAIPVIKVFTPDANCTWHLSEYDPETREFFGLCDLGMGFPELGYVSRDELEAIRGRLGLPVEREMYGTLDKSYREMLGMTE